jgi:hypothetical protein
MMCPPLTLSSFFLLSNVHHIYRTDLADLLYTPPYLQRAITSSAMGGRDIFHNMVFASLDISAE